jgi:Fe-S cluster assembly protein SufD
LNNTISQVQLKSGAQVKHTKIQDEDPQAFHLSVQRVSQDRDSSYSSNSFSFGALLSRNNLKIDFLGRGASCNLNGLFWVDGNRQADVYTDTEHQVENCNSSELYKGILDDKGKGVFRGRIKVHQDAQKSDARLNNTNLLLSQEAEIDTMPQLEIYADDVKCSHGSGSGQLDNEQLFYLTSRGIDHSVAHALLVFGFANSVLEGIKSNSLKTHLKALLITKLSANNEIKELVQ